MGEIRVDRGVDGHIRGKAPAGGDAGLDVGIELLEIAAGDLVARISPYGCQRRYDLQIPAGIDAGETLDLHGLAEIAIIVAVAGEEPHAMIDVALVAAQRIESPDLVFAGALEA